MKTGKIGCKSIIKSHRERERVCEIERYRGGGVNRGKEITTTTKKKRPRQKEK